VEAGAAFQALNRLPEMTGPQAALAYVLANPHVACAVTGTTRLAHLSENMAASGMILPPHALSLIKAAQGRRLSG
jgi:aryl-alcohol dehydrogenase-like predicted oxidoreductase